MKIHFYKELYTENKETRLEQDTYELVLDGYVFFEMEDAISVYREKNGSVIGTAKILSVYFEQNTTKIIYKLVSLKTVN